MTRDEQRDKKKKQVKMLFLQGEKLTAMRINEVIRTSDARKYISVLRKEGFPIKDKVIDIRSGTKAYYLDKEAYAKGLQLSLF